MAEPLLSSRASHRRQRLAQLEMEQQAEDIEAFEAIRTCSVDVDGDGEVANCQWWDLDGLAFRDSTKTTNGSQQRPITPPLVTKPAKQDSEFYFPQNVKILLQKHLAKKELRNQRSPIKTVFDIAETDMDATVRVPTAKRKSRPTVAIIPFPRGEGEEGEAETETETDIDTDTDATIRLPTAKRTCRVSLATINTGTTDSNASSTNKFPLTPIPINRDHSTTTTNTTSPLRSPLVMSRARSRAHTLSSTSTSRPPTSLDRAWGRIRGSGCEIQRKVTPAGGVIMGGSSCSNSGVSVKRKRG